MRATPLRSALAAVALLAWTPAVAEPQAAADTITPFQIATMRSVAAAEMAPDGRHVAYVLSVPRTPGEDEDGSARSQLHVLDCDSGTSTPFVTAESGVGSVRWAPDGQEIGFLAKREGDEQRALYMIPLRGGEARRALALDDRGVEAYEFAPDGSRVAFLATVPESKARKAEQKKGFKARVYEEDWRPAELWLAVPFDEHGEPRRVALDGHVSDLEWSPDGARLAVAVAPTSLVDDGYMRKRVWIVDVTSGEVTARVGTKGKLGAFRWSPDGAGLALVAGLDEHDGAAARLMWAPLAGAAAGATVEPLPMLGERERDEHEPLWLPGGELVVLGSQGAWSTLDQFRVGGGQAVDRRPLLPLEGPVWSGVSLSRDGRRAALVGSTPAHPRELFTLDVGSSGARRRTDSNPWLTSLRLAAQEVVRYQARDGLTIEGVLIHPLEAQGAAPLIVSVHGGPESHLSNGWLTYYSYAGQLAAARGYAVFYPNYRGSTGRGLAFLKQSQGDPAGKEFDDVVDGVDHLIGLGLVDRARVGVTGGSYGGYATGWLSTFYSDRFAAGVMFVGISDKISKVGTTDIPDEEFYVHALRRPWEDWQFFLERSPIYHADKGRTPLLIMGGTEDTRVDPGQSRELYRHLKLRGEAPVRLVNYPGEGHGNRNAGARLDYNLRMMRWFDHYLMGEGSDPPDWQIDYDEYLPAGEQEAEDQA